MQIQLDGVPGQSSGGQDRVRDVRTVGDPVGVLVKAFALYRTTHRPRAADVVGVDERAQQRDGKPYERFTSRHGSVEKKKKSTVSSFVRTFEREIGGDGGGGAQFRVVVPNSSELRSNAQGGTLMFSDKSTTQRRYTFTAITRYS